MIDLRKPLEGVPGLLLMAALIFFGATIGIAIALMFSWLVMKDSLANFLGGVVGAGFGAALAVLGAVYVQRKDRKDALIAPATELIFKLTELQLDVFALAHNLQSPPDDYVLHTVHYGHARQEARALAEKFATMTFPFELGQKFGSDVERVSKSSQLAMSAIVQDLGNPSLSGELKTQRTASAARLVVAQIDSLLTRLGDEFKMPVTTLSGRLDGPHSRDTTGRPSETQSPSG